MRPTPARHYADCRSARKGTLPDIYRAIGCNYEGGILSLLASEPGRLDSFWSGVKPAFESHLIQSAAADLCQCASRLVQDAVRLSDHLSWLRQNGFSREDSRQIRYVVESFYHAEPVFAVLADVALNWLRHGEIDFRCPENWRESTCTDPAFTEAISLVSEHECLSCLAPAGERCGWPVHVFYRALAVWPEYLDMLWQDLAQPPNPDGYRNAVQCISDTFDLTPHGRADCRSEVEQSIERCLASSIDVIVLACAIRRRFIASEVAARLHRPQ